MPKFKGFANHSLATNGLAHISQFFQFAALNTHYRTELLASGTTFMAIAPVLVVNAHILGNAVFLQQPGDLFDQLLVASALCAAVGSIVIGLLANYPIAVGPGTGTAALFAFSIVLGMGMNWRLAFVAAFVQGVIFTALSLSPWRQQLEQAIPNSLKKAMVAALGLFLAYIALSGKADADHLGAGIIVTSMATTTALGSLKQPATLMALVGIFGTAWLTVRQVKGGLLLGVLGTALLGWLCGVASLPHHLLAVPQFPVELMRQTIAGWQYLTWSQLGNFITVVFILLFIALSDTISALNVLGHQLDQLKPNGELRHSQSALCANAISTTVGGFVGSVPAIPYLESASGIFEGGRSGFVAIAVALLLLLSTLFAPLFAAVPAFATAPVLVIIGVMMMSAVRFINWDDLVEAIPAFLMLLITPLTFSIANGVGAGLIAHAVVQLGQRNSRMERSSLVLAAIAIAYFMLSAV